MSRDPDMAAADMRNNNGVYLIVGVLLAVILVGGFLFYRERHKSGIDVEVGNKGISVETH